MRLGIPHEVDEKVLTLAVMLTTTTMMLKIAIFLQFLLVIALSFRLPGGTGLSRSSSKLRISLARTGQHGTGFKYLPLLRGSPDEHFPRIIHIAGVYPELTLEEVLAPHSPPAGDPGTWMYDFADPEGPQLGTVAIPGSEAITDCIDPVAIISKNTALGITYAEEVECLVVVDRGDLRFFNDKFYLCKTSTNKLIIQWMERQDPSYEIVGRVVLCMVPHVQGAMPKKSGFLEEDD